jgi:hypothetical protein
VLNRALVEPMDLLRDVARVPCSAGRFTFHRIRMQRRVDLLEFIGSPILVCADHYSGHKIYLHAMK